MTTFSRANTIVWLIVTSSALMILGNNDQDPSNATAAPTVEIALDCRNERVTQIASFAATLGGTPETISVENTPFMLPLPDEESSLNFPVCGDLAPVGGKGYWFPVTRETYGEIDLIFCTMTATPMKIIATVYQAPRISANEITNCEDTTCLAIGTQDPFDEDVQFKGEICSNANNLGGVHFTASRGHLYFVYVDVTANVTELSGFEVITIVSKRAGSPPFTSSSPISSDNSPSATSASSLWIPTSVATLLMFHSFILVLGGLNY